MALAHADSPTDALDGLDALISTAADAQIREWESSIERTVHVIALARAARRRGSRVLDACATRLGLTRPTLHAYALVGACWTEFELRRILSRRNAQGQPISAYHLERLARLPGTLRGDLLERVFRESLSVSALDSLLRRRSIGVTSP